MRVLVVAGALLGIGWLIVRGTLEAPVSVFNAPAAYGGAYAASHPLALLALIAVVAAMAMWWRGGAYLPVRPLRIALALPLLALILSAWRGVYPHDGWYDLWTICVALALYGILVDAIAPQETSRSWSQTTDLPPPTKRRRARRRIVLPIMGGGGPEDVDEPPPPSDHDSPLPAPPPPEEPPTAEANGEVVASEDLSAPPSFFRELPEWIGEKGEEPVPADRWPIAWRPKQRLPRDRPEEVPEPPVTGEGAPPTALAPLPSPRRERRTHGRHAGRAPTSSITDKIRRLTDWTVAWVKHLPHRFPRLPAVGPQRRGADVPKWLPVSLRDAILVSMALGGCALALLAARQFLVGTPTPVGWTGPSLAHLIPVRVTATLRNPNAYGSVCLLFLGVSTVLALGERRPLRVVGISALALNTMALVLTFSRGAYLGLVALVVITALLLGTERRRNTHSALAAVVLPCLLLGAVLPGVFHRTKTIVVGTSALATRLFTWHDVLRMFDARPLLGVGPGGINVLYPVFFALKTFSTEVLITIPGGADNDPLQWLATTGIVGSCALVVCLVIWWVAMHRRLRSRAMRAGRIRAVAPLVGALAAIAVQGLFETTAFLLPVELLGAVVLALLTVDAGLVRQQYRTTRYRSGLVAGVLALVLALLLFRPWPGFSTYLQGWSQVVSGNVATAVPNLSVAAASDPSNSRYWAALGDATVIESALETSKGTPLPPSFTASARTDLVTALRLDPFDSNTWLVAATWETEEGSALAAACAAQQSMRDNPYAAEAAFWFAGELDKLGATYAQASRQNYGYTARLLPLVLEVLRQDGETSTSPGYATDEQILAQATATWGSGPLPTTPAEPLSAAQCKPLLSSSLLWPKAI